MSQNPLNIWREMLEHTIIQYILNNWPTEYWILNNFSIQFNSIHSVGPGPTEYWIILLNNYSVFSWSIIQYSVDYSVFSWSISLIIFMINNESLLLFFFHNLNWISIQNLYSVNIQSWLMTSHESQVTTPKTELRGDWITE